jgi:uncharacterized membrane protein YsdA (DUF1294 family)
MTLITENLPTILLVIAGLYLLMSLLTGVQYWRDKRISQRNLRFLKQQDRVSERSLHLMELFFGWPGALIAQRTLRHKNAKRPYQLVFWLIVLLHILAWGGLIAWLVISW